MYKQGLQTTRRTKGTMNQWQSTAWIPKAKPRIQPKKSKVTTKPLKNNIREAKEDLSWIDRKLKQNKIMNQ